MSTEYRRGIPSIAHVEAATRLGLLWQDNEDDRWRIEMRLNTPHYVCLSTKDRNLLLAQQNFRPIRADGTPVDWEVLDAEARAAQSATVTPTASTAPTTQPQGFRADLWRRICAWVESTYLPNIASIVSINDDGIIGQARRYSWDVLGLDTQTDEADRQALIARWAVYQELKPLYDLVDGAQGEVAMPEDVELEWCLRGDYAAAAASEDWILKRGTELTIERPSVHWHPIWRPGETPLGIPILNFAAVLDAVAEQRVAARQGQVRETVGLTMACNLTVPTVTATQPAAPEPRSFADVRPDRHGWRWWLVQGATSNDALYNAPEARRRMYVANGGYRWTRHSERTMHSFILENWLDRTVIPTDEQGNPVSWESIGQGQNAAVPPLNEEVRRIENAVAASVQEQMTRPINWRAVSLADTTRAFQQLQEFTSRAITQAVIGDEQRLAENPELWREAQWRAVSSTRTAEAIYQDLLARHRARMSGGYPLSGNSVGAVLMDDALRQQPTEPTPLPRFTADELDDVDHSATTTQDSATLKRGKLPTVEAIGKYREVMAKRNGTVAEAVKASGIDCEVAQYVLERWASGVSDGEVLGLLRVVPFSREGRNLTKAEVDQYATPASQRRPTLDTSEPADTAAQRQRAEAAERQARMAALQAQLAKERAARIADPEPELSRFALLEVDEAADPAKSIETWKAQRAALKRARVVRPIPAPQPSPRRKPFEVVDAQADGLSGTAALAVLLGRAMNGGC